VTRGRSLPCWVALAISLTLIASLPSAAAARAPKAVSQAVTFPVQNLNRSKLACSTDGAAYQLHGHLVGPRSALSSVRKRTRTAAATLYLHGLGFGEWFWNFTAVPGYNYATSQARLGHVSVVIDRLGYDSSGRPEGKGSCIGGQADMAHQVVQQLRKGTYAVAGGKPRRFRKIALAGHSAGAEIANVEAYSFRDVDALVVMSFSFSNQPRAQLALGPTRDLCLKGGEPAEAGAPSGYAYYGQPPANDFTSIMFANIAAPVAAAATGLRNRDPCGDTDSIVRSLSQQSQYVPKIKVPVLVVCGTRDALYSSLGCSFQEERYTGARSSTLQLVKGAGHGLTLERSARGFRKRVSRWLRRHGF
jgi:pimeloyl-ACP methyl ester carboxylesterase